MRNAATNNCDDALLSLTSLRHQGAQTTATSDRSRGSGRRRRLNGTPGRCHGKGSIPLTPPPATGLNDLGKSERPAAGDGVPLKDRTDVGRRRRRGRTFRSLIVVVVCSEFQQNTSQRVDTFIERVTKPDSGLIDSTPFSARPTETYRNVFLTRRSIYCYLFIGGPRGSRSR